MNVSHVMVSSKYPRTKQGIGTTMVFGQSMSWTLEILQTSHGAPILPPGYMLAKCWTAARGLISTWIAAMLLPGGNQRRSGWRWYSGWSLVMDLGGVKGVSEFFIDERARDKPADQKVHEGLLVLH